MICDTCGEYDGLVCNETCEYFARLEARRVQAVGAGLCFVGCALIVGLALLARMFGGGW